MTDAAPKSSTRLTYGIQLPIQTLTRTRRPWIAESWEEGATVDDLARVAITAEESGFGFVSVCDHVAIPPVEYTRNMSTTWYDPMATLGYLAAVTRTIHLLTTVFIPAYRHPLVSAKGFITLDRLSGGRIIAGLGAGHVEAEFAALGVDFRTRGKRLDECIDIMRQVFADEYCEYKGPLIQFDRVGLAPRPIQPSIPIWVGGASRAALNRVAERADGWIPQGTPRDQMSDVIHSIRTRADQIGRLRPIDIGFMPEWIYVGEPSWDVSSWCITGSPSRIADSLRQGIELGCSVLHLRFRSRSVKELCDQLARFGTEVAPLLGAS